jgi:ribosomal protein L11 methyltransferase
VSEPYKQDRGINYYQEISILIPTAHVDAVTNYIIDNICGGLVLEEEENSPETKIKFYVDEDSNLTSKIANLKKYLRAIEPGLAVAGVEQREISNLDWEAAYQKSVMPIEIGTSVVIKPPWNKEKFDGRVKIILEPKMAFGTGRHETTRGTLVELEEMNLMGKKVLDLGCGSGILGIYAAKRGASEVWGYDIDPLAVENSRENYRLNNVTHICQAGMGSIVDVEPGKVFDVVVVNIIKSVIKPIIGNLKKITTSGGSIVLSGLLEQDQFEINNALKEHQITEYSIRNDNGWLTYTIKVI